jgi:hypothetical protein
MTPEEQAQDLCTACIKEHHPGISHLCEEIAAAIRAARIEALEEAAKIITKHAHKWNVRTESGKAAYILLGCVGAIIVREKGKP